MHPVRQLLHRGAGLLSGSIKAEIEALGGPVRARGAPISKRNMSATVGIRKSLVEFSNGDCVFFDNQDPPLHGL